MQSSGQSGGQDGARKFDRWVRELLLAKNPLGIPTDIPWQPPTDVFETPETMVVRMEVPGLDVSSLSICLSDDVLTVKGHRDDFCTRRKERFQQMEIRFGNFERSVPLTSAVRYEDATAEYVNGFLVIELPRSPREADVSTFYIRINL